MKKGKLIASLNLIKEGDVIVVCITDPADPKDNIVIVHKIEYHTAKGKTSLEFIQINDKLDHFRITLMTACNNQEKFTTPDDDNDKRKFQFFVTPYTQKELVKVLLDHMSA